MDVTVTLCGVCERPGEVGVWDLARLDRLLAGLGGTAGGLALKHLGGTAGGGGLELEYEDLRLRECDATAPIGVLPRGDCRGVRELSRLHDPLPALLKKGDGSGGREFPL
jgi:hypothetical protein